MPIRAIQRIILTTPLKNVERFAKQKQKENGIG